MKKNLNPNNIFQRFKGLFSIGLSDALAAGISSLFWIYMATIIGPESYGELFYLFAIGNIAISISLLGSKSTLMVYVPKNIKLESTLFLIVIIFSLITTLIVFLIYSNYEIGLYIFGGVIFGLGGTELLAKKLYTNSFVLLMIQKSLMVVLSIGLYYYIGLPGVILGIGFSFLPYLLIVIKEFKTTQINFSLLKPRFIFISGAFGQNLLANLSSQVDKLFIAPMLGFILLGNYQLSLQFIAVFQLLPFIIMKFILPHDASGNPNRNLKIISILTSICLTGLIILVAPLVIPILFEGFTHVVELIQILSLSLIPLSVSTIYTSQLLGAEKSKTVIIGSIISFVTSILGIIILGNIFGIIGITVSYVLAMSVLCVFFLIIDLKKINFN
jgi:O-antigen/teichoic acid export membrane protein